MLPIIFVQSIDAGQPRQIGSGCLPAEAASQPAASAADAELLQKISRRDANAFAALPAEQREVLRLAYFEGCSQSEIGGRLQVPLGRVKTRVRQAMKKLHKLLIAYL